MFSSYRWESEDPEKLSSSPKVTQPGELGMGLKLRLASDYTPFSVFLALLGAQMYVDGVPTAPLPFSWHL